MYRSDGHNRRCYFYGVCGIADYFDRVLRKIFLKELKKIKDLFYTNLIFESKKRSREISRLLFFGAGKRT